MSGLLIIAIAITEPIVGEMVLANPRFVDSDILKMRVLRLEDDRKFATPSHIAHPLKGHPDYSITPILLPDERGGVLWPKKLAINSRNGKIYAIGRYDYGTGNYVSVCNNEGRINSIKVGYGSIALAYNHIENKLYCLGWRDSTLSVIDGETDSVLKVIQLKGRRPTDLVWNSLENKVYCSRKKGNTTNVILVVIDCSNDSIITEIPMTGKSSERSYPHLLFNPISNKVYCFHYDPLVDVLDCTGNTILPSIKLEEHIMSQIFDPKDNRIYGTQYSNNKVVAIDCSSDSVIATIPVCKQPKVLAYNSIMNLIYVGGYDEIVTVIDCQTNQVLTNIPINGKWVDGMAFDSLDNRVFVSTNRDQVDVIDCYTQTVIEHLPTDENPETILWDDNLNRIWIANTGYSNNPGYTLDSYDARNLTGRVNIVIGYPPINSTLNPDILKCLSVSRFTSSYVAIAKPEKVVIKRSANHPRDCIHNDQNFYVSHNYNDTLTVISCSNDSTVAIVKLEGKGAQSIAFDATDNKLYTANTYSDNVSVIDAGNNSLIKTIKLPDESPNFIAWNPRDNKCYVSTQSPPAHVHVIDCQSDEVIATLGCGGLPNIIGYNHVSDKVYAVSYLDGDVTIIDGAGDSIITRVDLREGGEAWPIAFAHDPIDNLVYISCSGNPDFVAVIDGVTDSLLTKIFLPSRTYINFGLLHNPSDNTLWWPVFYSQPDVGIYDAIAIIDCSTNSIVDILLTDVYYSTTVIDPINGPRKSINIDTITNTIFLSHPYASRISMIKKSPGIEARANPHPGSTSFTIYPNPFHRGVFISGDFGDGDRISIYNILGQKIRELRGINRVFWDGRDCKNKPVPSGIYFLIFEVGNSQLVKKVLRIGGLK